MVVFGGAGARAGGCGSIRGANGVMDQVQVLNCHSYRDCVKRLAAGGKSSVCVFVCFKLISIKLSRY